MFEPLLFGVSQLAGETALVLGELAQPFLGALGVDFRALQLDFDVRALFRQPFDVAFALLYRRPQRA